MRLFAYLLVLLFVVASVSAYTVELVSNTDQCFACESVYRICKDSVSEPSFDVKFYDSVSEKQYSYDLYQKVESDVVKSEPVYAEKLEPIKCSDVLVVDSKDSVVVCGKDDKDANTTSKEYAIDGYVDGLPAVKESFVASYNDVVVKEVYDKPVDKPDFKDVPVGACRDVVVRGSLKQGESIDNVLVVDGVEYKHWVWWNNSWEHSKVVTVNSTVSSNLNDFVFPVVVDTATLISEGHLQNDCDDLRILDANNNELLYELEDCNNAKTVMWVYGNLTGNANTTFTLYYKNDEAVATSTASFWIKTNAIAVYHGTGLLDSTGFNNLTVGAGSVTYVNNASCKWGKCIRYNATNTYLKNVTGTLYLPMAATPSTAFVWWAGFTNGTARLDLLSWGDKVNFKARTTVTNPVAYASMNMDIYGGSGANYYPRSVWNKVLENAYTSVALNGTHGLSCYNGICNMSLFSSTLATTVSKYGLNFGNIEAYANFQPGYDGIPVFYDEVRIYNASLSNDTIIATHNLLVTLGAEQSASVSCSIGQNMTANGCDECVWNAYNSSGICVQLVCSVGQNATQLGCLCEPGSNPNTVTGICQAVITGGSRRYVLGDSGSVPDTPLFWSDIGVFVNRNIGLVAVLIIVLLMGVSRRLKRG